MRGELMGPARPRSWLVGWLAWSTFALGLVGILALIAVDIARGERLLPPPDWSQIRLERGLYWAAAELALLGSVAVAAWLGDDRPSFRIGWAVFFLGAANVVVLMLSCSGREAVVDVRDPGQVRLCRNLVFACAAVALLGLVVATFGQPLASWRERRRWERTSADRDLSGF
jgi:hypothetical protein